MNSIRKAFYRKLDEKKAKVGEAIDKDKVKTFWQRIWNIEERTQNYQELIDLVTSVELQTDFNDDQIKAIVEQRLKYLANWKTPGLDQIYNFFIK